VGIQKLLKTISPWITVNPLIHHLTTSDLKAIKEAIDKATNCDFEIVNLSFSSRLNMKNYTPDYLEKCKKFYLCAEKKGMEIGDYSLI
jgi:hypothetical protein